MGFYLFFEGFLLLETTALADGAGARLRLTGR